ncbi:MAG: RidA family protein [Phycisphaerales bacterium]
MIPMDVYARLSELGLELPPAPTPVAAYVPAVRSGDLVFVSGQIPMLNGSLVCAGPVPEEVPPDKAKTAARMCGLNLLAVLHNTIGDLNKVRRVIRLGVFVASAPDFTEQPKVANGASELMVAVFGDETGRHARAAVGSIALPLGATVEVEGVFEVE